MAEHFSGMHKALERGITFPPPPHPKSKILVIWASSSSVSIKHRHGGHNSSLLVCQLEKCCTLCFSHSVLVTLHTSDKILTTG